MEYLTKSEAETEALGARLAEQLEPGGVVAFTGDLGAGKTAFTRGLARGGVCAVEWSENVEDALEEDAVRVDIRRGDGEDWRVIAIEGVEL